MRTRFIHHRGLRWEVFDTTDQLADRAPASGAHRRLYFLSRFSSRASDDFPSEWYRLPDEALVRLCESARIIGAHAPYVSDLATHEGRGR